MYSKLYKNRFFVKIVSCVILVSFVLSAIVLPSYADITGSANLRKSSARKDGGAGEILTVLYEKKNMLALFDGKDIELPKDRIFSGKVDHVITISDYVRTLVPGLTYLEGESLDAFIENLRSNKLFVVCTGDNLQDMKINLLEPVMNKLKKEELGLLEKLIVLYNSGNAALGLTSDKQVKHYWQADILSVQERILYSGLLIVSFWEQVKKWKNNFNLSEQEIYAISQELLEKFRETTRSDAEWKKASSEQAFRFHLIPQDKLNDFGDIYITDSGSGIVLEFNDASKKLIDALGTDILPLTTLIAEQVGKTKGGQIKYINPGPSFVDVTQSQKKDAVLRLFNMPEIKEKIPGGKAGIFLLGDSNNDTHLNLQDEDFERLNISGLTIPVFVGKNKEVAGKFVRRPVITAAKEAAGGLLMLKVIPHVAGNDLSGIFVADGGNENHVKYKLNMLYGALEKIGLKDINSIALSITSQIPKGITAEELNFMVCKDGLWVLGPEREEESQFFMRLNAGNHIDITQEMTGIILKAKATMRVDGTDSISQFIRGENKNIIKVLVPAEEPQARRQLALQIFSNLLTEKKIIADGLTYEQPSYSISPVMERMIFGAQMEKKFLDDFQKGAESAKVKYPELVKFIEHLKDPDSGPYELNIPVEEWNLTQISANIKKLARFALAGMRDTKNPLFTGDLNQPINIIQLLLVGNELAEMALEQAKSENRESIDCIVSGEVRYDTFLLNEQLRRRFAEMGISVHSSPKGTYLPIGATSFITTFLDMMFTIYTTSSHSGRSIISDKLMGFQKVPVSPFIQKHLKEMGIDEKEYSRSRSEGAQFLVEQMLVLADRIDARIKKAGKVLTFKFAAGHDKNIHYDIQNPASDKNIDVIKEYADYLRRGFVSQANIKSVQEALNNGMMMGISSTRGAAYKFFREVYKEVFGNNVAQNIQWLETVPDPFFGDTGMSDFKKDIEDPFLYQYVRVSKDRLDAYFRNLPFRSSLLAAISEKDLAKEIKAAPREGKTAMNIRFSVWSKDEEVLLKKIGMPYLEISNDRLLVYYEPKIRDASQDVSLLEVVSASKLPALMFSMPIGYRLPITDPDGDRYVELQVEKNTKENRELLKKLNVGYLVLSEEKLLVVYVPNQTFLQIESAYIQQLKDMNKFHQDIGDKEAVTFFAIKTTVSSSTWLELCTAEGVPVIQVPVGFREIGAIMRKIEFQLMVNKIRKHLGLKPRMVVIHDIFDNPVKLGYNPRQLSGKEESGGLVLGTSELLVTKDGMRSYLSWREKNAIDPSISMLIGTSERFNKARDEALKRGIKPEDLYKDEKFLQDISLLKWLNEIYAKYNMKNTAELRSDIELVDSLEVAKVKQKDPPLADKMKEDAVLRRDTNFAFFLSLAFAFRDGHVDLNEVKAILKENLLADAKMIERIKSVTNDSAVEILVKQIDDLRALKFAGDQVYMEFSNGAWEIVRPSGTDPKIKSYPSTADPVVSAVISNAIGEVYPEIFFALGAGKTDKNMPATDAYVKKMRQKNSVLLEVKGTKDFQQTQYERGAKVDTITDWAADEGIQKVLEQNFPETTRDGRIVCSAHIFLGPVSQKEALRYDPEAHIIYASWAFDDKMKEAENKAELFAKTFALDGGFKANARIAEKLGVDIPRFINFMDMQDSIHEETSGYVFDTFTFMIKYLLSQAQNTYSFQETKALMVDTQFFFKAGASKSMQKLVGLVNNNFKIGLYGQGADKLKVLLGGSENIITADTEKELIKELHGQNIKSENIVDLASVPWSSELQVKKLVFSKEGLAIVDLSAALGRLVSTGNIHFKKLFEELNENKIIAQDDYNPSVRSEDLGVVGGKEMSAVYIELPAIMPSEAVAKKIEDDVKKTQDFITEVFI